MAQNPKTEQKIDKTPPPPFTQEQINWLLKNYGIIGREIDSLKDRVDILEGP